MSSLNIRRLVVWTISIVVGVVLSMIILTFVLPGVSPNPNAEPVSISQYGIQYFFWTAFPLALMIMTVLDHFFETKIWPD
ncbi:MAG: hypothetical protein ACOCX5_02660 [Chloroflexota bacterium]